MPRVDYTNRKTLAREEAQGSDGRLDVSSRVDSRGYYTSRDQEQSYTLPFDHQGAVAAEFSLYIKNDSSTKTLVVSAIGLNTVEAARIKFKFVTGTAAGGSVITPTNTNKSSSHAADATCREGDSADAVTGLTADGELDFVYVQATGHEQLRLDDRIRLGQNDAVALEYDEGTTGDFTGVVFFYFE